MIDTLTPDIRSFAAAVRVELADLPADDVDDLLDGLEADLAEQAADSGDAFVLPDAVAYAAELRSAAGLPDRPVGDAPRVPLRERLERLRLLAAARIRTNAAGAWTLDLLVALRPVWWLIRGFALYVLLASVVTIGLTGSAVYLDTPLAWIALFATTLLSIQWGRGAWVGAAPLRALRSIVTVLTAVTAVILVIAAPTVVPRLFAASSAMSDVGYVDTTQPGLALDGVRIRNIYPYDAEGKPLTGVQLFDQDGRELTTVGQAGAIETWEWDQYFAGGGGPVPAPAAGTSARPTWNVFPLLESAADDEWGQPVPDSATPPALPFPTAPSVLLRTATPAGVEPTPTRDAATPLPTEPAP